MRFVASLQRAAAIELLAARFSVDATREWTVVRLDVHRDRFEAALPLVADALLRPRWLADDWSRAYPRELAAFPVAGLRRAKYWPPVGRIDGVYGDRNVFCNCPPVEAYQ